MINMLGKFWKSKLVNLKINIKIEIILVFVLLFTINLVLSVNFVDGNILKHLYPMQGDVDLRSVTLIIKEFGLNDAGNYISIGQELSENLKISEKSVWALNVWPIGQIVIHAVIFKIFGFESALLAYVFLTILIYSLFFTYFYASLSRFYDSTLSIILLIFVTLFLHYDNWVLGIGIFFSETYSLIFFLTYIFFILQVFNIHTPINKRNSAFTKGILSGGLISCATLLRAQYYLVVIFITLLLLLILIRNYAGKKNMISKYENIFIMGHLIASTSILGLYLNIKNRITDTAYFQIVDEGFRWKIPWISGTDWLSESGGSWGCRISQISCAEISSSNFNYRLETINAILETPLNFSKDRLYYIARAWFSTSENGTVGQYNFIYGGILLLIVSILLIKRELFVNQKRIALISTIVLALLLPFAITQIEVRYILPIKIIIMMYLVTIILEKNRKVHD